MNYVTIVLDNGWPHHGRGVGGAHDVRLHLIDACWESVPVQGDELRARHVERSVEPAVPGPAAAARRFR